MRFTLKLGETVMQGGFPQRAKYLYDGRHMVAKLSPFNCNEQEARELVDLLNAGHAATQLKTRQGH